MTFTIKTTFDLSEKLVFSALNEDDSYAGVLQIKDEKIFFTDADDKKLNFGDDVKKFEEYVEENKLHFNRPAAEDSHWVMYQPNPKNYKTGDCTIRAYTKAENISWEDAYDIAAEVGMEVSALPDDNKVVDKVLTERFSYKKIKLKKDERLTINEFAIANPCGTYVVHVRGHLVTIVDGLYYDSWDSGKKKIDAYYEK